ncbi:MAG: DUF86 domain-containing protein [Symploca sp. SIO3E6]|nr:DUF86 domain-containing protein [Caldora sp. SIO3E6]
MAGLRDVLTHAYFSLEEQTLWDIVQNKVPPLREMVQHMVKLEFGE